jgi:hypothetical protein
MCNHLGEALTSNLPQSRLCRNISLSRNLSVMVSSRIPFAMTWLVTAVLILVAGAIEYAGYRFLATAEVLTLCSAVGTLALTVLAFRAFWKARASETVAAALGLACSPFVLGWVLSLNGTEPNIHGAAIGGLYFYALVSEVTAVILLFSSIVRNMRSRWKDSAP